MSFDFCLMKTFAPYDSRLLSLECLFLYFVIHVVSDTLVLFFFVKGFFFLAFFELFAYWISFALNLFFHVCRKTGPLLREVMSAPRGIAHMFKNTFGSADNIPDAVNEGASNVGHSTFYNNANSPEG